MTTQDVAVRLDRLEREHARLEAEYARLEAELTSTRDRLSRLQPLEQDVTRLRAANVGLADRLRAQESANPKTKTEDRRMSRGDFLRFGGAAAAGAVAVGAGGLVSASPANAASGASLIIGQVNNPTNPTDTTFLYNSSGTDLSPNLFKVANATNATVILTGARIALAGTTTGADTTSQPKVGVWGQTDDLNDHGAGVIGRAGTTGVDPLVFTLGSTGVIGSALDGGNGVVGYVNGPSAFAVQGVTDAGFGVSGYSLTGISIDAAGGGRLHQAPRSSAGSPTSGSFIAGEQIRDLNGELWLCVANGTPGTWRRAVTVKEGFSGGSVNLLSQPIRLFDSRSGAPLASGSAVDVQVTGVVVGTVSVPSGAVGVIGTVTVTQTQAPSGYLTLYPQGSPPSPATSSVNWFGSNQNLATAAMVALNPTNGKLTIHNGIVGGSALSHVIFDVSAFVI